MTRVKRILVACDGSPLSRAAIDRAAALAERLDAELEVLYVEDINVLRLLDHPLVHTYSQAGARRHEVGDELIEKSLQLQIAAARAAVEEAIARRSVKGRFDVRRGKVDKELEQAADGADMVFLGWSGRPQPGSRPRLGSVARSLAGAAPSSVALVQKAVSGPVMALWDGGEGAGRALAVAATLAAHDGGCVELMIPSDDALCIADLQAQAAELLSPLGLETRLRCVGRMRRLLTHLDPDGILVVPADNGLPIEELPCSVVVAR